MLTPPGLRVRDDKVVVEPVREMFQLGRGGWFQSRESRFTFAVNIFNPWGVGLLNFAVSDIGGQLIAVDFVDIAFMEDYVWSAYDRTQARDIDVIVV